MSLYCWIRGLWYRYWYPQDIPISGHEGLEQEDGTIRCVDCSAMLYDPRAGGEK